MRAIESATNVVYSAAYLRSHRTGQLRSFPAHKEFRAGGQRDSILEAQAYSWTAYQICHRHGHWLMSRRVFPVVRPPVSPAKGQERVRESSAREREHEVCDASLDPHRVVDAVFYAPPPHTRPHSLYIDVTYRRYTFLLHQNARKKKARGHGHETSNGVRYFTGFSHSHPGGATAHSQSQRGRATDSITMLHHVDRALRVPAAM